MALLAWERMFGSDPDHFTSQGLNKCWLVRSVRETKFWFATQTKISLRDVRLFSKGQTLWKGPGLRYTVESYTTTEYRNAFESQSKLILTHLLT